MADRRGLVITSPGSIGLQDAPELVPGPGEVVARPVYTGICGTDLELLAGVVDPAYVRYPLVPGHEWSGVIEAVGPGVTGLEPGQPVTAEGIVPDRVCAECAAGHTNLCLIYDELGFTRAGAAADQVLLPAQVVHVLGGSVSLLEAALAEPAAVAWRAIGRGRSQPGERVASFAYTSAAFAEVTALLGAGEIRAAPLITHRFPLEAYDQAYQVLRAGPKDSGPRGKVMLEVGTP
jgi:threonine dehydrogenase-like Zn-dependent dehydrogenase